MLQIHCREVIESEALGAHTAPLGNNLLRKSSDCNHLLGGWPGVHYFPGEGL
jgi:hypothetical protein